MCGIVGYTGRDQAVGYLLEGLSTLEYRGYDSAGVEVVGTDGELHGVKCAGRVATLVERCETANLVGTCGIAHTRWATHGAPTDKNSHPHRDCTGRIAVVHNGIIENFRELRGYLQRIGHTLVSDTDSEVIAHLIEDAWAGPCRGDLVTAVRHACRRLRGSWALAVVCADAPGEIVCARNGSPLVAASTERGAYAASDVTPLAGVSSHVIQLENGQFARLEQSGAVTVYDEEGLVVGDPATMDIDWDASAATLGGYADFMAKEIAEQPEAIERLLSGRLGEKGIVLDELSMSERDLAAIDRVYLIACGTSYHVSLIARTLIQTWAKVPVVCDYASEFNYEQDVLVTPHTLCVIITQSGETADTLTAARRMKGMGCKVFAVTNVLGSTAAREADGVLYVQAGPEVCVASTKAYTAQMVASALLALRLAQAKRQMDLPEVGRHYRDLCAIPDLIREVLSRSWLPPRALGALPRPRRQRDDRLRGIAQAQGDQLPARRGISGGGDEAWPHRPARAGLPGGCHRPGRPRPRQDRIQHPGGHCARRHVRGRRHGRRRGRGLARRARPVDPAGARRAARAHRRGGAPADSRPLRGKDARL